MAKIYPITQKNNSKIYAYKFHVYLGKSTNGKQLVKTKTWYIPEGTTPAKARKIAQAEADIWEANLKNNTAVTLIRFVNEYWFPLHVNSGQLKPKTIEFYSRQANLITKVFGNTAIKDINPVDIQKHITSLGNIRTQYNKPPTSRSIHHFYRVFKNIMSFAVLHDVLDKSPFDKLKAPKKEFKPVMAMDSTQTKLFLSGLADKPLHMRTMLTLLVTTGIRRGELCGLQWGDIDWTSNTITVQRNAVYTPNTGVIIDTPKTTNSIRTIPLLPMVIDLLKEYRPPRVNSNYYIFGNRNPYSPNKVTHIVREYCKTLGLDISPHDLRHTTATLLVHAGADIKSVQNILGHKDASTTLDYYVKSDLGQMVNAANMLSNIL